MSTPSSPDSWVGSTGTNPLARPAPYMRGFSEEEMRELDEAMNRKLRDLGMDPEELWWLFGGRRPDPLPGGA